MKQFRFEKTSFGWKAHKYSEAHRAYLYIGHFKTQREARDEEVETVKAGDVKPLTDLVADYEEELLAK